VAYEAAGSLVRHEIPKTSTAGIILAGVSLVVMPLLSRAKRKIASAMNSAALSADATQTRFCAYLSAILLGGLLLNAFARIWWADPVAALVMVPIIANEGMEAVRGRTCCASNCTH